MGNAQSQGDGEIGPLHTGSMDLTLLFEHIFFTIVPSALTILATPLYVYCIISQTPFVRRGVLFWVKKGLAILLVGANVAILVFWGVDEVFRSSVSLTASALSCIASVCIAVILYAEHRFSYQPSTFLSVFLSVTTLLDIAKTYSCFKRPELTAAGGVYAVIVLLQLLLLLSQEIPKRRLIDTERLNLQLGREAVSGFWNRSFFLWMNAAFLLGYRKILAVEDLPPINPEFSSSRMLRKFETQWSRANKTAKFALARTCLLALFGRFSLIVLPRLCFMGFTLAQPFLILRIINAVGEGNLPQAISDGLIGAAIVVYFGIAVSRASYTHGANQVTTQLRGMLIAAIYDKMLRLTPEELDNSAAATLISSDMTNIERLVPFSHNIWASIMELILGMFILSIFAGPAAVLMVFPALVTTVGSIIIAEKMGVARIAWSEQTEQRVARVSDTLVQLKSIKMSGLGPSVSKFVQKMRDEEIKTSMRERSLRVVLHALNAFTVSTTPILVIAGALFWTRVHHGLTVAQTFVTLAVVAIVSEPLAMALLAIPLFSISLASLSRMQNFLNLDEQIDRRSKVFEVAQVGPGAPSVRATNISVTSDTSAAIFGGVDLQLTSGNVAMISGPVGCGKSSLLKALIGEVALHMGVIEVSSQPIAYAAQTPWIQNLSVRENIVGQSKLISAWYDQVVSACALNEDLGAMPAGDKTLVGTGGCNLSGGQKQRVALARAIYSRAPILALDDSLSAIDTTTSRAILNRLFGESGLLKNSNVTVIMVTSLREHFSVADFVFTFDGEGRLQRLPASVRNLQKESSSIKLLSAPLHHSKQESENSQPQQAPSSPPAKAPPEEDGIARQKGDHRLYSYYLNSAKRVVLGLFLIVVVLAALGERMPQIYMRIWMHRDHYDKSYFVGYAMLGVAYILLSITNTLLYYRQIVSTTSIVLHRRLLDAVFNATLHFLAETDAGTILNRFSQDMTVIAQKLPETFLNASYATTSIIIDVGIIASGATYAAAIIPVFVIIMFAVQRFYLRTSRQLRLLDLEVRSPLNTLLMETMSGIQHIRSFQWQQQFKDQLLDSLDHAQIPYYYVFCAQAWLALVMDLCTLAIATALISLALKFTGTTNESAVGLALLNIVTFSTNLSPTIQCWVDLEMTLGAVARVKAFVTNAPQEQDGPDILPLPDHWPSEGAIRFSSVTAKYRDDQPTAPKALDNMSFTIEPGQKVGIAGRTGGGKSSIIATILLMINYTGTVHIDGRELKAVPRHLLRSRIVTVTQDGVSLHGTIRFNVNPFDLPDYNGGFRLADSTLIEALSKVGVWDKIRTAGGLDAKLNAVNLSAGQRQLLSLARAILRKQYTAARIILIDEATSHLDVDVDRRIQAVIEEVFAGCTVIMVSHRLHTLDKMDIVLRVDNGQVLAVLKRDPDTGQLLEN